MKQFFKYIFQKIAENFKNIFSKTKQGSEKEKQIYQIAIQPEPPKDVEQVEKEIQQLPKKVASTPFSQFKNQIYVCLKGACRPISIVALITYVIIALIAIYCLIFGCEQNIGAIMLFIVSVLVLDAAISVFVSIYAAKSTTAFIFWVISLVPLVIGLLIFSFANVGLILIGIAFFYLIYRLTSQQ